MRGALAGKPVADFPRPDSVVAVEIDPTTNELATPQCPERREEFYIEGTEPTIPCSKHKIPSDEPGSKATTGDKEPPGSSAVNKPDAPGSSSP